VNISNFQLAERKTTEEDRTKTKINKALDDQLEPFDAVPTRQTLKPHTPHCQEITGRRRVLDITMSLLSDRQREDLCVYNNNNVQSELTVAIYFSRLDTSLCLNTCTLTITPKPLTPSNPRPVLNIRQIRRRNTRGF
jgi:hypothetical protein